MHIHSVPLRPSNNPFKNLPRGLNGIPSGQITRRSAGAVGWPRFEGTPKERSRRKDQRAEAARAAVPQVTTSEKKGGRLQCNTASEMQRRRTEALPEEM
ncbi:hypothetical protein NDU88_007767 [Pleurodeles waltl]|uniref:Uncharacterized protein n=1 Tax=Pleurodeles waltl TaxID=8319 RepID=A0AAV7VTT1_PLEWA|nr:hypothetical protein NDU88_007767 [Pleurodeles waltl]